MKFHVVPAPSGGAAKLLFSLAPTEAPLVLATHTPVAPDPRTPGTARVVVHEGVPYFEAENPFTAYDTTGRTYFQVLDTSPDLLKGPTYYHFYNADEVTTLLVDVREPDVEAHVFTGRDFIRQRLDYHLARFVRKGTFRLRATMNTVPILEVESVARDKPRPMILLKESLSPSNNEGIGKIGLEAEQGEALTRHFRYRCRIDLLVIADTGAERTLLANLIHQALLADFTLFEDAGYRETSVSRTMMSQPVDGHMQFAEEMTIDGVLEMIAQDEGRYTVRGVYATWQGEPISYPVTLEPELELTPYEPTPSGPVVPASDASAVAFSGHLSYQDDTVERALKSLIERKVEVGTLEALKLAVAELRGALAGGRYDFTQSTPSASWSVPIPVSWGVGAASVQVMVEGQIILPDIVENSLTRVVLSFPLPTTGSVTLLRGSA